MKQRILGTGLRVSALGLGCMGFSHAYGAPTKKKEAIRVIGSAYDMGYTFFDTAEVYGTEENPHDNEILVGEALKPCRNHVQIASKFGIRFDRSGSQVNHSLIPDSRPEVIRASVEGSLKRLQTDHIDLYFQHRMDPAVEPEMVAGVMADLIREGKILHWGISEVCEDYLRRAHRVCPVTAVENRYSMMARQYEALFPVLEELGDWSSDVKIREGFGIRQEIRLQKQHASVYAGGGGEKSGTFRFTGSDGPGEAGDSGSDFHGLDVMQKALDCSDSRH